MKTSELVSRLVTLMEEHRSDFEVKIDDGIDLCAIEEVDLSAEEDNCIVIWLEI